jgi:hypothetical protein
VRQLGSTGVFFDSREEDTEGLQAFGLRPHRAPNASTIVENTVGLSQRSIRRT